MALSMGLYSLLLCLALGCDAPSEGQGGAAGEDVPLGFDCGVIETSTFIECLNTSKREYTDNAELVLVLDQTANTQFSPSEMETCVTGVPAGGGAGQSGSLQALCASDTAAPGGIARRLELWGDATRTCPSAVRLFLDYRGELKLPKGRFRVSVDASSLENYLPTTENGTERSCDLLIDGRSADLIGRSRANVWTSFETGPRTLSIELDCADRDYAGFVGVTCSGYTPGLPGPAVTAEQHLVLSLSATPLEP